MTCRLLRLRRFAMITAVLQCGTALFAQRTPPPGWTSVLDLDGIESPSVIAYDDTVYVFGEVAGSGIAFAQSSTDGGATWQPMAIPRIGTPSANFPQSARLLGVGMIDRHPVTDISEDAGRTYREIICSETLPGDIVQIVAVPHRDGEIFLLTHQYNPTPIGSTESYWLYYSNDTGQTWYLILSTDPGFCAFAIDLGFPDTWYVDLAPYVDFGLLGPAMLYQTTDAGATFTPVKHFSPLAGVPSRGMVRTWWETKGDKGSWLHGAAGVMDFRVDSDSVASRADWIRAMEPAGGPTLVDSSLRWLMESSYRFDPDNPAHAIISAELHSFPARTFDSVWLMSTTDDGASWNRLLVLDSAPHGLPVVGLDARTGTAWVVVGVDTGSRYSTADAMHAQLWRSTTGATAVREGIGPPRDGVTLYPNPAHGTATVTIRSRSGGHVRIVVADLLGRIVWRDRWRAISPGTNAVSLALPVEVRTGMYIATVEGSVTGGDRLVVVR